MRRLHPLVVGSALLMLFAACGEGSSGDPDSSSDPDDEMTIGRGCSATATGCSCTNTGPANDEACYARNDGETCCVAPDRSTCDCGPKQEVQPQCLVDSSGGCICGAPGPVPPGNTVVAACTPAPVPAGQTVSCYSGPGYCTCRKDGKIFSGETPRATCPTNEPIYGCPGEQFQAKSCDGSCQPEWCKGSAGERCDINGCVNLEFTCQGLGTPGEKCGTIAVP